MYEACEAVLAKLAEISIEYDVIEHNVADTVEELLAALSLAEGEAEAAKTGCCKNMFLAHKKKPELMFLVVCRAGLDTKAMKLENLLAKHLKAGSGNLRFMMDPDVLWEHLGVRKGCVTPLSVVNDTGCKVQLIIDQKLLDQRVYCHPLINDRSVGLAPDDLLKFCDHHNHPAKIIDFEALAAGLPKPAPKKGAGKKGTEGCPAEGGKMVKKETKEGMSIRWEDDFPMWYQQVITKTEMIEFYDISGCYILRPWSFKMWEQIVGWFDGKIKESGVEACYFPIFVSEEALNKEKDHIADFAPEVAWVTRSGTSEMDAPIAVRPTSETIMYPAFAKWIKSHRDLPMRLNQWCNVVRWEFKNPTPFLRTREFLWQEGHTSFETKEEADLEVMEILGYYEHIYQELMAVPVICGRKTEKERFPGGDYTTTVEGYIPRVGRAIQGATSHGLGQNFAKMCGITFEDKKGETRYVWQNSWGCTTRTVGVMVMVHSDNEGLVLPPKMAPIQVIFITIPPDKKKDPEKQLSNAMLDAVYGTMAQLKARGIRCELDQSDNKTPAYKHNHWTMKGVPLRIVLGPKDFEQKQLTIKKRRDVNFEEFAPFDTAVDRIDHLLDQVQSEMFAQALAERDEKYKTVTEWKYFNKHLDDMCMMLVPFCDTVEAEEWIKENSKGMEGDGQSAGAKSLCIPFEQPEMPVGQMCITCQGPATVWCLFGRSY